MASDRIKRIIAQRLNMDEVGRNEDGDLEFIGTAKQWEAFSEEEMKVDLHDCHTSPNDGCNVCAKYNE